MYELLLFGQVPRSRHDQVLKVLAGVAAMQPQRIVERHIVYKPQREPEEPGSNIKKGGSQGVVQKQVKQSGVKDLYYTQTVQSLTEQDLKKGDGNPDLPSSAESSLFGAEVGEKSKWSFQFHDVPEAGKDDVLVRLASTTDIAEGDPHNYMVALGNNYVSEYYLEGHRFVHKNVIILLHRILQDTTLQPSVKSPQSSLPAWDALKPLDPSGAYMLQTSIRVQDLSKPNILDMGVQELKDFKSLMKGCVELDAPDRLLLDTRVKYQSRAFSGSHTPGTQTQTAVR